MVCRFIGQYSTDERGVAFFRNRHLYRYCRNRAGHFGGIGVNPYWPFPWSHIIWRYGDCATGDARSDYRSITAVIVCSNGAVDWLADGAWFNHNLDCAYHLLYRLCLGGGIVTLTGNRPLYGRSSDGFRR